MSHFDPKKPYNSLPELPPSQDVESRSVLKLCIEAREKLAELKQLGANLPNESVLINTIPFLEAQASSEIENIVTTSDQLFRYADIAEEQVDPATKEALRYRSALYEGYRSLSSRPLSTATAVSVCQRIKNTSLDIRKTPGTQLVNEQQGSVIYTPDGESLIREKLSNWQTFLHDAIDLDPLVRMAIGHYQFEAIHPFTDGNGRTGRILNLLYLVEQKLLDQPTLYLSGHINRSKSEYYRLLLEVTSEARWEEWLLYLIEAVRETASWTSDKVRAMHALFNHTVAYIRMRLPKIYSRELVEQLFIQPYIRIGNLTESNIAKRQTASVYLKKLCDIHVLQELKIGREKLFLHPKYLNLLTRDSNEFAHYS